MGNGDLTPLGLSGALLCHRYSGARLREIAELFNVGETAISEASKRFAGRLKEDKTLCRKVDMISGDFRKWEMET